MVEKVPPLYFGLNAGDTIVATKDQGVHGLATYIINAWYLFSATIYIHTDLGYYPIFLFDEVIDGDDEQTNRELEKYGLKIIEFGGYANLINTVESKIYLLRDYKEELEIFKRCVKKDSSLEKYEVVFVEDLVL